MFLLTPPLKTKNLHIKKVTQDAEMIEIKYVIAVSIPQNSCRAVVKEKLTQKETNDV